MDSAIKSYQKDQLARIIADYDKQIDNLRIKIVMSDLGEKLDNIEAVNQHRENLIKERNGFVRMLLKEMDKEDDKKTEPLATEKNET